MMGEAAFSNLIHFHACSYFTAANIMRHFSSKTKTCAHKLDRTEESPEESEFKCLVSEVHLWTALMEHLSGVWLLHTKHSDSPRFWNQSPICIYFVCHVK